MSRTAVIEVADDKAERSRFDRAKHKIRKVEYRNSADTWIVAYEERGKARAIGEHFVVLVDDKSKEASLFEWMAYGHTGSRQRLEEQIAKVILEKVGQEGTVR